LDSGDQEINSSETNNDYENFFNDLVQQSQEQSAGNGDEFSDIFISSNNSEKLFSVGSTTMNNFDNDDKYLGATKDIDKITLNCPQKEIIKRISDAQSSGKDITTVNISGINITKAENSENTFHGALLDTGAQKCVIGEKQARAYTHLQRQSFELLPSKEGFRFGKGSTKSMGILEMRIPIPNKQFIQASVNVVDTQIPFLVGLDMLDEFGIMVDNVDNVLHCKKENWKAPLVRKFGHIFYEWDCLPGKHVILYTERELVKLHRNFFHPSATKLFEILKKANPTETKTETLKVLKNISKACATCQSLENKPMHFQVSLPDTNIVFNQELALDLMFIDRKAILHVVDLATHYSAATFLKGQSVDHVWIAFLTCWVTIYPGFPNNMKTDQGSIFTSPRWQHLCKASGIVLKNSGIESHNSLGNGERYHNPLRRIFLKILKDHPNLDKVLALNITVKAMNDTMGPEGIVPTLLVYGIMPHVQATKGTLPNQKERMKAITTSQLEMNTITAELRIRKALLSKVPPSADYILNVGSKVRVVRESDRVIKGPFTITRVDGKQIFVDYDGTEKQFSITQIIPDQVLNGDYSLHELRKQLNSVTPDYLRHLKQGDEEKLINITRVIKKSDPLYHSEEFKMAKDIEIEGLLKRKTWKIVDLSDVPKDANIIGSRFDLSIKHIETENPRYKARFIAQGYNDIEKENLVHTASTLKVISLRTILAIAAVKQWKIWTHDVTQAFLQSESEMTRDVYLRPPKEFNLPNDKLLHLLKSLYGITDAIDYWGTTLDKHVINDLHMTRSTADRVLYFKREEREIKNEKENREFKKQNGNFEMCAKALTGHAGSHVDDIIHWYYRIYARIGLDIKEI